MIRRQIVRAGWAAMVLLVLTSCGMKDRKQTYPGDEGVTQQQEQAGGQSEKLRPREQNRGCPGNRQRGRGNAAGAGNAGGAGYQRCRECRNGRGCRKCRTSRGAGPEGPGTAVEAVQNLGACNQLISGRFFKAGTYGAVCPLNSRGKAGNQTG
ncbi:MAG: hypothetical protein ACLTBV_16750 [Enterocloster bolteae]